MFLSSSLKIKLSVAVSFFAALFLTILQPSLGLVAWLWPAWLVLSLLYWVLMLPQVVNLGCAWLIGIFLDLLGNTPVGVHALSLVLLTYFAIKFNSMIINGSLDRVFIMVFSLLFLYQLLLGLIQVYLGEYFNFWTIWGNSFINTLIWIFFSKLFNYNFKPYLIR